MVKCPNTPSKSVYVKGHTNAEFGTNCQVATGNGKILKMGTGIGMSQSSSPGLTDQKTQEDIWLEVFNYFKENDTMVIGLGIAVPIAIICLCAIFMLVKASVTALAWPFRLLFTGIEYILRCFASCLLYLVQACQWCRTRNRNDQQPTNEIEMRPLNQSNQLLPPAQGGTVNSAVNRINRQLRPAITYVEEV